MTTTFQLPDEGCLKIIQKLAIMAESLRKIDIPEGDCDGHLNKAEIAFQLLYIAEIIFDDSEAIARILDDEDLSVEMILDIISSLPEKI